MDDALKQQIAAETTSNPRVELLNKHARIEADPGTSLKKAVDDVVSFAHTNNCRVVCEFNGIDLEAEPGITPSTVEWLWHKERERRVAAAEAKREVDYKNALKGAVCEYRLCTQMTSCTKKPLVAPKVARATTYRVETVVPVFRAIQTRQTGQEVGDLEVRSGASHAL